MKKSDLKNGKKSLHLLDEELLTQTTCDIEDLKMEVQDSVNVCDKEKNQDEDS